MTRQRTSSPAKSCHKGAIRLSRYASVHLYLPGDPNDYQHVLKRERHMCTFLDRRAFIHRHRHREPCTPLCYIIQEDGTDHPLEDIDPTAH